MTSTGLILFDLLVPAWAVVALAALSGAVLATALWRGLAGWGLRLLAAMALLLALANPSIQSEERSPLSDIVIVLVDETSSQKLPGRAEQSARALEQVTAQVAALPNTELRVIRLGDSAEDKGSLILTRLTEAMAEEPRGRIAGMIVISDGQAHDIEAAPTLPAPLHLLQTGRASDWDRRLVVKNAPAFGILGETLELIVAVEDQGAVPASQPRSARMQISLNGETPQTVSVPVGQDLTLPLVLPHGGMNVVQLQLEAAPDELTDRNNAAVIQINGVRDRLRVLLVSGEPHAGERTWRNLLKSDSSVDLVHFTILRPPEKQDGVPVNELSLIAFPTKELFIDKIDEFDLIIFDRYRTWGILPASYMANIRRYVEDGGAVLVSAGPEYATVDSLYRTPLGFILPGAPTGSVVERPYHAEMTATGRRHPVTEGLDREFAALSGQPAGAGSGQLGLGQTGNDAPAAGGPGSGNGQPGTGTGTGTGNAQGQAQGSSDAAPPGWGRWLRYIDVVASSGSEVVLSAMGRPLLLLERVGEGRVALLASDHAWLWARGYEGGGPQLELLRRLAHWMMKEPELEEEALTATARGQEMRILRRSLSETIGTITVTAPDGTTHQLAAREVSPGRFEANFTGSEMGLYRLREGDLTAVIALGPSAPKEFEETIATPAVLMPLISPLRGAALRIEEGLPSLRRVDPGRPASGRGWIGITPRGAYVTADITVTPLAPPWLMLLIAALLTVGAWLWEGRRQR